MDGWRRKGEYECRVANLPPHTLLFFPSQPLLSLAEILSFNTFWFPLQSRKDKERPKQKHKKRPESPTSLTPSSVPVTTEKVPDTADAGSGCGAGNLHKLYSLRVKGSIRHWSRKEALPMYFLSLFLIFLLFPPLVPTPAPTLGISHCSCLAFCWC